MNRDQEYLLPPSMREWLPADDPLWLVIDTVAELDTSRLHAQRKTGGVGRAGYHPDMLLTLLIWGWAQGQRSSRQLERLCHRDIAYRIICAGDAPDHVTIARFRADCAEVVADLFTQVLVLCARVGMGQVGVVALDGVKIASNASLSANRTEEALRKALAAEAARAAAEHSVADSTDDQLHGDQRGDQLPDTLTDPRSRQARIAEALADLAEVNEEQARQQAEVARRQQDREDAAERARQERIQRNERVAQRHTDGTAGVGKGRLPAEIEVELLTATLERVRADYQAKVDARSPRQPGRRPVPVDQYWRVKRSQQAVDAALARQQVRRERAEAEKAERERARTQVCDTGDTAPTRAAATAETRGPREAQRNITDPQSRPMPLRGGGWVQGYNCQAVTSSDGLIIATGVSNSPADVVAFADMLDNAARAAELIATHRAVPYAWHPEIGVLLADAGYLSADNCTIAGPDRLIATGKTHVVDRAARENPTTGPPPADATPIEAMAHRLATPEGHSLYRQRSHIAETPFGHAKHNLGFRRFTGRGITRATAEFSFHAMVHNLFKAIGSGTLNPATI